MEFKFYPFDHKDSKIDKIVYKNRCVLFPNKDAESWRSPCGYVALKKTSIPSDWWGNYNAVGLQRLMIHGGLTYCRQEMVPGQTELQEKYLKKRLELDDEDIKDSTERALKKMDRRMKLEEDFNSELSASPEGYVVFGFDCGHYRDDQNENLKDPNHVMMLVEQMESQLIKFAEVYDQYKNANDAIKDVVRKSIMANIHREADIQCEMGFGALLEILKNGEE